MTRPGKALPLLALLAGCHLVFGHSPPGDREGPDLAPRDLARAEAPTNDGLDSRAADGAGRHDAPGLDAKSGPDSAKADARKPDAAKADAKKPDAAPPACNADGVCSTGETCPSCLDCCPCGEVNCSKAGVTCTVGGGTLTTPSTGAWKWISKPVLTFGGRPAGPVHARLYLCGVDFAAVTFTGYQPLNTGKGAYLGFGVAVPPVTEMDPRDSIFFNVTSTMPPDQASWNGVKPATHDQGYRKYLFQTWYRIGAAAKVESPTVKHQYNVEKKLAGTERFDLRLELWQDANGTSYVYRAASRMHTSAAKLEGCTWAWNAAINTKGAAAWVPIGGATATQSVPVTLAGAVVQVWLASGGDPSNPVQSLSYARAAVELIP
jgi:hypothetical protein